MTSTVLRDFETTVALKEPERVPAVIWAVAPWYLPRSHVLGRDYYQNKEIQLAVQLKLQAQYPDTLLLPGIYPDFGLAGEAAGFGCPLVWSQNNAPVPEPVISDMNQVLSLKPVNFETDGLFPEIIARYEYGFAHADPKLLEKFGYLDGAISLLGPIETAAAIRGYGDFLFELYDNPQLVHKLLEITTDTLLGWIRFAEKRIGKIKRLIIQDHFACQVSPDMFEEFVFPYLSRMFGEYPDAIRLWHNEGNVEQILPRIPDMGPDIFHFGTDLKKTKEAIGDRICLMGNLKPVELMQFGTAEQVHEEAMRALEIGAPGGGFILTTAGAVGGDTPDENIKAMLDAARLYRAK